MAITQTENLKVLLKDAIDSGCGQSQIRRFILAGYVPQQRQMEFHAAARLCDEPGGPTRVAMGGTRGQAKTHAVMAQALIDDCQRFEGLKLLYLRRMGKSAKEAFEDQIHKILYNIPHDYKPSQGMLHFPNGSRARLGGFFTERDIDAYLGIEYDGAIIEDATNLSENKIQAIRGSIRTSKTGWRPREYYSFNPGGIGHAWARQTFWEPYKRGTEGDTRFIHTTMGDNVFINSEYEKYLNSLTGILRQMWRDGDMEVQAGAYFLTWDEDSHVREMSIDPSWQFWLSLDYGFVHWNVVYLMAKTDDGDVLVLDEYAARRTLVPQHCQSIDAMLDRHGLNRSHIHSWFAGPDIFAKRGTERTIAETYEDEGIRWEPAQTDRISGAAKLLDYLGDPREGITPRIYFSPRCRGAIATIPTMLSDPKRPEDVLKVDCDPDTGEGGDDYYDGVRYGLMVSFVPKGAGAKVPVNLLARQPAGEMMRRR